MTGTHVPLNIGLECRPPEPVEERSPGGVKAAMSEGVVSLLDQGRSLRLWYDELMAALRMSPP